MTTSPKPNEESSAQAAGPEAPTPRTWKDSPVPRKYEEGDIPTVGQALDRQAARITELERELSTCQAELRAANERIANADRVAAEFQGRFLAERKARGGKP